MENEIINKEEVIEKPRTKKKPKFERVILDDESKVICKNALTQLNDKYPGLKVSKSDLVNWVLKNVFKNLKPPIEKKIYKAFYDEEMFLAMTLKEIRKKKRNGEKVDIKKMLKKIADLSSGSKTDSHAVDENQSSS